MEVVEGGIDVEEFPVLLFNVLLPSYYLVYRVLLVRLVELVYSAHQLTLHHRLLACLSLLG